MSLSSSPQLAPRTCLACKNSKKKCDKLLPTCGRCSRLSIECSYVDPDRQEANGSNEIHDPRFEEIFRRLNTLEGHVLPQIQTARGGSSGLEPASSDDSINITPAPTDWSLDPSSLNPHWMGFILWGSVLRVLRENSTSVEDIIERYFSHLHHWLPMVSRERMEKQRIDFNELEPSEDFALLILAMHLTITPTNEHPKHDNLKNSPWYRACKYHFGQFVALSEPTLSLIQAGMLIALFEYSQCIEERAWTTLGICARLAYALGIDELVDRIPTWGTAHISLEEEESLLTWWGLLLLDRYFNMPPLPYPKHPVIPPHPHHQSCLSPDSPVYTLSRRFVTTDQSDIDNCLLEIEASHLLAQVQALIRENSTNNAKPTPRKAVEAKCATIIQHTNALLTTLREHEMRNASWPGIAVTLFTSLLAQTLLTPLAPPLIPLITGIKSLVAQCQIVHGFDLGNIEGIPPSWYSIIYATALAQRLMGEVGLMEGEDECLERMVWVLGMVGGRVGLAGRCLEMLRNGRG